MKAGLFDTSVWVAGEAGRRFDAARLPERAYVCVITVGELQAGVLAARDTATRARRLATMSELASLSALPVDNAAAAHWAELRVRLHDAGRRVNVNDLWIAAIARANGLPVVAQDADFHPLAELGLVEVVQV